jgi:hypothetical protein
LSGEIAIGIAVPLTATVSTGFNWRDDASSSSTLISRLSAFET